MRGSTRKRGSTWTALWDVTNPTTGGRQQKSKGGFRRQRDAERFLQETLPKVAAGTYFEPSAEPVAQFMRQWVQAVEPNVKPLTARRYRQTIEGQIAPRAIGSVPLRQLGPDHVLGLLAELQHDGLAVATRSVIHAVLRRALNDAVRWEKISRNPAASVKAPRAGQTRVTAWTAGELRRFLAYVEHDRLTGLWRLAATTGMRRGELLGLRWQDVDLDGARLRVEQQALPTPGGVTFGSPKSKRSRRTITLDAATLDALRGHRDRQVVEQSLAGDAYEHQHDLAFGDELGRVMHPNALSNQFVVRRKRAGIPVGSIHVLRHTHATLALEARVPLHVVAARLGDRPETMLATYAHLLPTSDAAAADAVAAALVDNPLTTAAG
jgi:integrase